MTTSADKVDRGPDLIALDLPPAQPSRGDESGLTLGRRRQRPASTATPLARWPVALPWQYWGRWRLFRSCAQRCATYPSAAQVPDEKARALADTGISAPASPPRAARLRVCKVAQARKPACTARPARLQRAARRCQRVALARPLLTQTQHLYAFQRQARVQTRSCPPRYAHEQAFAQNQSAEGFDGHGPRHSVTGFVFSFHLVPNTVGMSVYYSLKRWRCV